MGTWARDDPWSGRVVTGRVKHLVTFLRKWMERGRGEVSLVSMARVFATLCALGIAILSARQLGPARRGEIVLVVTVAMIASEVMFLGADVTGRIQILSRRGVGIEDFLGLTVALTLLQGVAVSVSLIVIQRATGIIETDLIPLGVFLGVAMFQAGMLTAAGFALRKPVAIALRDMLVGLLPLVVVFVLVSSRGLSAEAVVGLVAMGYAVGDVYLWIVVSRHSGPIGLRPVIWAQLLRSSRPVFASAVAQTAALRGDRILIGLAVGATGLGVYSVAATAVEVPRLLLISATQILANRIAAGQIEPSACLYLVRRIVVLYGLLLTSLVVVASRLVVPVVGAGFSEAVSLIVVLAIAEFFLGVHLTMAGVLTGLAHFTSLPVATVVGGLLITLGGLVVVQGGGVMEVAWLKVGVFGVMAAVSSQLVLRGLQQPTYFRRDPR